MRLARVMAAAVVMLATVPAGAFHEDDLPLIASAGALGSGWIAFDIATDGSKHAIDVMGTALSGPAQIGLFTYDETDAFTGGFTFTAFSANRGVFLEVNEGPVVLHEDTITYPAGGAFGLGLTANDPEFGAPFVGTYTVVMWFAGSASWSWAVRGEAGSAIAASDAGDSAYLFMSKDFTSTAHVQAYQRGLGGRAQLEGSLPIEVADGLIGLYLNGLTSVAQMSVTTPRGEVACHTGPVTVPLILGAACVFFDLAGDGVSGPGTYTFHSSGAGAGPAGFDDVWFGGADARLPG